MKNWKTTLFGALAAAAGGIAAANVDPLITKICMTVAPIFAGMVGFFAKDSNVTGGNVQQ